MPKITHNDLRKLAREVFEALGAPPATATIVSDSLVDTSLVGKDTHGIRLIQRYVNSIEAGKIDPKAEPTLHLDDGPVGIVDGQKGFGQLAARTAVDAGMAKARTFGVGVVGIRNGYHIGRVGQYALRGAEQGFVVIAFANASAQVAPFGSSERIFGTNPFCCAAPRKNGEPIVVDAASSLGTVGEVELAKAMGRALPEGILIDEEGQSTNDPNQFGKGALLPIGKHKGSALSLMVEILAGVLTGRGCAATTPGFAGNGALFIVIDPVRFQESFASDLDTLCERITGAKIAEGFDRVRLPGEPEIEQEAERSASGVPIPPDAWEFLKEKASAFNLSIPTTRGDKPIVLFVNQFAPAIRKQYANALANCCELVFPNQYDLKNILPLAAEANVLVGYRFPRPLLEAASSARLIQLTSAGVDAIDLAHLKERAFTVANSHANAGMVAEHAFAMLMTLSKKTALHDRLMRNGVKSRNASDNPVYASSTLAGSTIGILGLGHIGSQIAQMLKGFDVKILAYSRSSRNGVEVTSNLNRVLESSDYLFVCLPLTSETEMMISYQQLSLMKREACLINVSRSAIVREEDLYRALKDGVIHAAAVDVWTESKEVRGLTGTKQFPSKFPFHKLDNVLLSPHRAALRRMAPEDVIDNLGRFAAGQELINVVSLEKGY